MRAFHFEAKIRYEVGTFEVHPNQGTMPCMPTCTCPALVQRLQRSCRVCVRQQWHPRRTLRWWRPL
jgi:hypothetical protein